ncbi:MAG: S41 family peptidase [Muribaculaceae bacterium]|nr:S41 family peptidase [Muribaculaceae bacterium]
MKRIIISILTLAALICPCLDASAQSQLARLAQEGYGSILKLRAANKIAQAEKLIEQFYVDSVDTDKLAEEAIKGMLATLDPHSSYSDPEETKELTTPLDGNFSGIGIQFNMLNDTLYVIQTTSGGPSEKVGILPGDRLIQADDSLISGVKRPNSEIIKMLRGPKGTKVNLKILRKGVTDPICFTVVRDDIPVYSIDAAYMADPTTGYIRLSRFSESTPKEMTDAMNKLRRQGMKNLILDLQDNGGGLLGSAIDLAARFLDRDDLVVYTKSPSMGDHFYTTDTDGEFRDGRVVVLVNQYSASASEITSGAIQDYDRGVIVGRRTFGKGLVQRPFPFPDGSMIRLTVAKYYTPSGRCIQKPYELGKGDEYRKDILNRYESGEFSSADSIHFSDSERYATLRTGRTVYGGGGVMPDVFVPVDTTGYSTYYRDLTAKGVISRFAISYVDKHRKELTRLYPTEQKFLDNFTVSPAMIDEIVAMGVKESVDPDPEKLEISRKTIETIVKGIIGRDLFETQTYFKVVNPVLNPVFVRGLEIVNDPDEYARLLSPAGK